MTHQRVSRTTPGETGQGHASVLVVDDEPPVRDDALGKGDVLIVAKRDRLGRDVLNVAMFERLAERKGARIVSAAGEGTDTN